MIVRAYRVKIQLNRWGDCEEKVFLDLKEAEDYFEKAEYWGSKNIMNEWALIED